MPPSPTSSTAPIFLIGYRGTGKTTVAPLLAAKLGYAWVDSDDQIEQAAGKSIADIFADDGEPAFRNWEVQVVQQLSQQRSIVAALGGGAVLRDENQLAIKNSRAVIWLTAPIDTIANRIADDGATAHRRPNLTPTGGKAEIEALLELRAPIYRACATLVIDTEGKSPAQIVDEIIGHL